MEAQGWEFDSFSNRMKGQEMSMRPRMNLVFGIDDFEGNLDYEELESRSLAVPQEEIVNDVFGKGYLQDVFYDRQTNKWKSVVDSLVWGGFGIGSSSNIIGMAINRTRYDSDFVRVMALFHPEYETTGKKDIPVWERGGNHIGYERRLFVTQHGGEKKLSHCKDIEFQWSWFYPSIIEGHHMWPVHAYCTRYLLERAGIKIDYHRYKAMLFWEWC